MLEKQQFFDLQEHEGSLGDPRSWLSREEEEDEEDHNHSSPSQHSLSNANGNSFDPVLYKNLVEVLPLLESFIEVKSKTSFTRKAPLVYTKTPTKGSNLKKGREPKGKKIIQPIPAIKRKDIGDNKPNIDESVHDLPIMPSRASSVEKDTEELVMLQEQVENLKHKLLEKDEHLKSAEASRNEMTLVHAKIDALKRQVAEKESLIKSAQLQLSDVNVKLADKQAALEKMQCDLSTSNRKVEELQDEMDSIQGERAAFGFLAESLTRDSCPAYAEDYNTCPSYPDLLLCEITSTQVEGLESSSLDETDSPTSVFFVSEPANVVLVDAAWQEDYMSEKEMQEMEEAREAYVSAVAAAKDNQDEELLVIAAQARSRLQTLILTPRCPTSHFKNQSL